MAEFSLTEFASFAVGLIAKVEHEQKTALEKGAKIIADEAKRVIGTYDYGWPPLSPSTIAKKGADTPLLETGELRESIEYNADHHEAYIGSDLDRAVFHELGTPTVPPRPFLTSAAVRKGQEVADAIGEHIVKQVLAPKD